LGGITEKAGTVRTPHAISENRRDMIWVPKPEHPMKTQEDKIMKTWKNAVISALLCLTLLLAEAAQTGLAIFPAKASAAYTYSNSYTIVVGEKKNVSSNPVITDYDVTISDDQFSWSVVEGRDFVKLENYTYQTCHVTGLKKGTAVLECTYRYHVKIPDAHGYVESGTWRTRHYYYEIKVEGGKTEPVEPAPPATKPEPPVSEPAYPVTKAFVLQPGDKLHIVLSDFYTATEKKADTSSYIWELVSGDGVAKVTSATSVGIVESLKKGTAVIRSVHTYLAWKKNDSGKLKLYRYEKTRYFSIQVKDTVDYVKENDLMLGYISVVDSNGTLANVVKKNIKWNFQMSSLGLQFKLTYFLSFSDDEIDIGGTEVIAYTPFSFTSVKKVKHTEGDNYTVSGEYRGCRYSFTLVSDCYQS